MKPSEYKALYENLTINLGDDRTSTVSVNKYRWKQPVDGGITRKKLTDKVSVVRDFETGGGLI
jgi:hypothetical protein